MSVMFHQGFAAFEQGIALEDNPYSVGNGNAWADGWLAAQKFWHN